MTIIGGIIQIICMLLPVILAGIAANNTPKALENKANEKADKAIVDGDIDTINVILHDGLQDKNNSNTSKS